MDCGCFCAVLGGVLSEGLTHRRLRMSLVQPDCTAKCRSQQHAGQVVAALTGGSEGQLRAFLTAHCHNAATLRDAFGRSALHMAASVGKRALMEWLLESKGAEVTAKDKESGWTAVHRSAFYGQIHCLVSLVQVGLTVRVGVMVQVGLMGPGWKRPHCKILTRLTI